jgi:hypothetical protein
MHTQTEITSADAPAPRRLSSRECRLSAPVVGVDPDAVCVVLLSSGDLTVATETTEIDAICNREFAAMAFEGDSLADMVE